MKKNKGGRNMGIFEGKVAVITGDHGWQLTT